MPLITRIRRAADDLLGGPWPSSLGPALLLVAVAWTPAPLFLVSESSVFTDFDVPKRFVLVLGALALAVAAAIRSPTERRLASPDGVRLHGAWIAALAVALFACAGALGGGAIAGPATAIACVAVALLVSAAPGEHGAAVTIARAVAVAAAVSGLYALCQLAGIDSAPWRELRRPVSTFGNTSFAAEFQAAALPWCALLALRRGAGRGDRLLGAVAALLAGAHLFIATSRIDYVAAAAGLGVAYALWLRGRGRTRASNALLGGGLLAGAALAVVFYLAAAGADSSLLGRSDTLAVRLGVWRSALGVVADAPFRLPGEEFIELIVPFRAMSEYQLSLGRSVATAHNDLLTLAATQGVVPALIALAVLVAILLRAWASPSAGADTPAGSGPAGSGPAGSGSVSSAPEDPVIRAALGGAVLAVVVSGLASSPLDHPSTALLLALACGALLGLPTGATEEAGKAGLRWPSRYAFAGAAMVVLPVLPGALGELRADAFLQLGREALIAGDGPAALRNLHAATKADQRAFAPRYELGALLRDGGNSGGALVELHAAHELRPNQMQCRASLAYALRDTGALDAATTLLDESLAICSWHPLILAARGAIHLQANRPAEAIADLDRAAPLLPPEPRLRAMRAEAELALRPTAEARENALAALRELFGDGDVKRFAPFVQAMLDRDPGFLITISVRARRVAKDDSDFAAALVLAAAQITHDAGFLEESGAVLIRAGHENIGKELFGMAFAVKAQEALRQGRFEDAERFALRAVERSKTTSHYILLARALTELGQRRDAISAIGRALAVGTFDPGIVRGDPTLSELLPDPELETLLERAAMRFE